jgi:nitroreductase
VAHPKQARPDHPIDPLLARRWSPCSFADKDVPTPDLLAMFEAARWAASSYNEQPWRFILARRAEPEAFAKMLSCLVEGNQQWARHAPVLLIGVAMLRHARNGTPNKAAAHDLGLATGNLSTQATARDLYVHQMGGIVPSRVRQLYKLPDGAEPLTALAIGYLGDGSNLPASVARRDQGTRDRRVLSEFVFEQTWDHPASIVR